MKKQALTLRSLLAVAFVTVCAGALSAQPTNPPTAGDLLCSVDTSAIARQDTLPSTYDADGYLSLFDGKSFKGWWHNCRTGHSSSGNTSGAIFRVDTTRGWIYSTQRNGNIGGILTTKKRYKHYDIVFETWPGFNNDGGLFNRYTTNGGCYQTVLDYLTGASYGGSYGENWVMGRDQRPSSLGNNDSTLTIPGNSFGGGASWTTVTAAAALRGWKTGCPSTGCTQADWRAKWKMSSAADGWNTVRIKFYGGLGQNQNLTTGDKIHMISYFRNKTDTATNMRVDLMNWVMLFADSINLSNSQANSNPANPIGLQVHGGGRFGAARGTWYRNIRIRELDSLGNPLYVPVSVAPSQKSVPAARRYDLQVASGSIVGKVDLDHDITISDMSGRVLERFSGKAGNVNHILGSKSKGVLFVEIKTSAGASSLRLNTLAD